MVSAYTIVGSSDKADEAHQVSLLPSCLDSLEGIADEVITVNACWDACNRSQLSEICEQYENVKICGVQ